MKQTKWKDEYFNEADEGYEESKAHRKASKRKWREIENIKEKQRLRREMQSYDSYSL